MVKTVKTDASELGDDVTLQMMVLREDIAQLTATVAEYSKAQGLQLKSAAAEKAAGLAQTGTETAAAVKHKAEVAYSDAENSVRENPAAAVGIAAGLGFLVGMLATRR